MDKASKETQLITDEQPLYIDESDRKIKCKWCGDLFKGSISLKHVNQHVNKAVAHKAARQRYFQLQAGEQNGMQDIRSFFSNL